MYSAIVIAKYIVTFCAKAEKPISNLKLQKMLYFIWIDYFKATGKYLFKDDICAWQFGPVVPDVYYEFCPFGGIPINRTFDEANSLVRTEDKAIIDNAINTYLPYSASYLVDKTHQPGTAWSVTYRNGLGLREVIRPLTIIEAEC